MKFNEKRRNLFRLTRRSSSSLYKFSGSLIGKKISLLLCTAYFLYGLQFQYFNGLIQVHAGQANEISETENGEKTKPEKYVSPFDIFPQTTKYQIAVFHLRYHDVSIDRFEVGFRKGNVSMTIF